MSLNPLNELKRRLHDDSTPLPKRLCLARNVVQSHHFPTAPKERVVAEWLQNLMKVNRISSTELKDLIGWLNAIDDFTNELKSRLIQVVSQYLKCNPLKHDDIECIVLFMENPKIFTQLTQQIDEYLYITMTLLQNLKCDNGNNVQLTSRILNNLTIYYKECKKKLEFIIKLLDGENLETLFGYLNSDHHDTVIDVCQNIIFPMNKKSFFISFLQTLIRKDNIDELIAEKGDNIQSVLKIMSVFFTFPKGRTAKEQQFLADFINVFVSCFKSESQMIFAFYIMVVSSLNMNQSYLSPAMKMPPIIFEENDEKIKRNLFLNMLNILLHNDIDINVRLTDTFGEKISKVEIKKNFTSFLQTVMLGQLKLEGKLDKSTLNIIKTALNLDPILVEQKMDLILPPIMTAKKNNSSLRESYIEMLSCLLEILFKLSRGISFINQILPQIKLSLEACNTEQFELKQKIKECLEDGKDCEKLKSKVITKNDIFPQECVDIYGKWTSELMFRQNKELLISLQKDLEEHCLMMLEEGFVSPSIITLAEVLSAILCSSFRHNKMADHTVPQQIAEDFWSTFQTFENECLKRFGNCVLKLNYNQSLSLCFLQLCLNFAQLKLLNIKYCNFKLDISAVSPKDVFDLSVMLPCLSGEQWTTLAGKLSDEEIIVMDNLLIMKTIAMIVLSSKNPNIKYCEEVLSVKSHLIKQLSTNPDIISNSYNSRVLFSNLEKTQLKSLAKTLVKLCLNNPEVDIFRSDAVANNRSLLHAIVMEIIKNVSKYFENSEDLTKAINKSDFDLVSFLIGVDVKKYFNEISVKENQDDIILQYIEMLKQLPLPFLEESCQLVIIFVLLISKKCCQLKKIRQNVDHILQRLYELSPKYPDLYKVFPVKFIFSFKDNTLIDLLTLKIKNSNSLLIIKSILESAVKKVKTDSEIVKNLVEILLNKQESKKDDASSIEYFSNPVFQISCIILPIIAKEKKAITTSAYRSILANLQEKLHKSMLECFKNIDFSSNSSLSLDTTGYMEGSIIKSENVIATVNAMGAYSLTLSKYCETTDAEEIKNLNCLWSGLEFFFHSAIQYIHNPFTKQQHVDSAIQLLNVILRHKKKIEAHPIFKIKDSVYLQIWKSVVSRSLIFFGREDRKKKGNDGCMEDMAITLKFICELASVECYVNNFVSDLSRMSEMKNPAQIMKSEETPSTLTLHKVYEYLWIQCLKANLVGPKCVAHTKLMYKNCKSLRFWIQQHYEFSQEGRYERKRRSDEAEAEENEVKVVKVEDVICDIIKVDLDTLSQAILAAKKISLDHKFIDIIFELQHLVHYTLGCRTTHIVCEVSWTSFFKLFEGCVAVLNSFLISREELLEDRWPCYMQCYRALVSCLCMRSSAQAQLERPVEEKLAELSHSIEKLTQSMCKRKAHVSRIAAYTVADMCARLESCGVRRPVRQHLETSALCAWGASEAGAFLRRALAGRAGHATAATLHLDYTRYHKYVGNA